MRQNQIVAAARQAIMRVGYSETARRSGIDRRTLYRSFSPTPGRGNGNPKLSTLLAVLPAVGLGLCVCIGDSQP